MADADWQELTARERAVLGAVERRLSNAEIAAEFYISVRTVESHIASLRRKLDVDSRSKLINAAQSRRGTAVQLPQNSFVGRRADLDAVLTLLDRERWVTIVGPAGSGKTRLALELAAADDRIPVVVELEHARASEVVNVVAKTIGLGTDSSADLISACGVALEPQPYLLVIDNCDRVTQAVGELVSRLLVLAGSLSVLTTSRSPIGVSDETVFQLAPLPVDPREGSGAMRMFLDRAASAAPTTEFSDDDSAVVESICRRLDGLPLAIELAAARVRHLTIRELAARLEDGFGPLDRAGPPNRHRTLEAAFDWTWDLLDDEERSVLSRLAALPRTFDIDLAEAVAGAGSDSVVLRLLDRSLVSPAHKVSDPRRFRMLESLRAFVLDRTDPAIVEDVRRTHAHLHAGMAAMLRQRARTDDSRQAAEQAKRLCPEVNAAVDWALSHSEPGLAVTLAVALSVGGEQYGPDVDSLRSIARTARDPLAREVVTTTNLLEMGIALCYSDIELVGDLAELALGIADDKPSRLAAAHLAGIADAYLHRGKSAMTHLEAAEGLADELLDSWQLASIRQTKGIALRGRELYDPEAAMGSFEAAMRTYALAGDAMHVNNARYMMAATAAEAGTHTQRALAWAEDCVAYSRETGNRHELAHAMLTRAAISAGPTSEDDLFEAVARFRAVGDLRCLTRGYLLLARDREPAERVHLIEQALDVAVKAHDVEHQSVALERLIHAHFDAGDHRSAAIALGILTNVVGYEAALSRCPDAMAHRIAEWETAVAEGQARGR